MFQNLTLTRPLVVIDLETTGTDTQTDRIVEIGVVKVFPDGRRDARCRRVNPRMPISAAASAIHGIYDADVADQPCPPSFCIRRRRTGWATRSP
jgi:DNA polymerase-3 subunit epsilon